MKIVTKKYFIELCQHLEIYTNSAWNEYYKTNISEYSLPYPKSPLDQYSGFAWETVNWRQKIDTKLCYDHTAFVAREFGIASQREWARFIKDVSAKIDFPVPTNVPIYYKSRDKWIDWSSFLNTEKYSAQIRHDQFVSYKDAVSLLKTLDIKTASDYRELVKSGITGSQLPSNPNVAYKEWKSWNEFLAPKYLSYKLAQKKVKEMNISTRKEFQDNRPAGIPSAPFTYYKKEWTSWQHFLGTAVKSKAS